MADLLIEQPKTMFGGNFESSYYSNEQRNELEKGVDLDIRIPEGFVYSQKKFEEALDKVRGQQSRDWQEVIKNRQAGDTDQAEWVDVREIKDTMETGGWSKLANDFGIDKQFEYGRKLLALGKYARKSLCQQDELRLYGYEEGGRRKYGVESGQHRILAAKVLAEMGCEVGLVNIKVIQVK